MKSMRALRDFLSLEFSNESHLRMPAERVRLLSGCSLSTVLFVLHFASDINLFASKI